MKFLDNKEDDSQWLPISDLMTVLMAIFLIISIIYLNERLSPAQKYIKTKADIYNDLEKTFKDNNWKGYEIDKQDLSIKFVSPEILFDFGKSEIKTEFQDILDDFIPSFVEILRKYDLDIEDIIIEGHTDDNYDKEKYDEVEGYFINMGISQERARKVLEYSISNSLLYSDNRNWARNKLAAHGYSWNKPYNDSLNNKNRRVEFKVKLIADETISRTIE